MFKNIIYTTLLAGWMLAAAGCSKNLETNDGPSGGGTVITPPNLIEPNFPNLALGSIATASSFREGEGPELLVDGKIIMPVNTGMYFSQTSSQNQAVWVKLELSHSKEFNEIWIYPSYHASHGGFPVDFTIAVSNDDSNWTTLRSYKDYPAPKAVWPPQKFSFDNVTAKYVRVLASKVYSTANEWTGYNDTYYMSLSEIEIYKRDMSVLEVHYDLPFVMTGEVHRMNVDMLTEHAPDGSEVTVEIVTASDNKTLVQRIYSSDEIRSNSASLSVDIPASLKPGQYRLDAIVQTPSQSARLYSTAFSAQAAGNRTFYVSYLNGSDSNDGLSEQKPFKTLTRVSQELLMPGECILLNRGETWQGEGLYPQGSGTREKPITIGAYGTGAKPRINPGFPTSPYQSENIYGIRVVNGSGYEIRNIEVMNTYGGIVFVALNKYNLEYILIEDCYLHDCTGHKSGFGDGWSNKIYLPDIHTGCGVSINATDAYFNSRVFDEVTIRNCEFYLCDVGINFSSRDWDPEERWETHGKDRCGPNNIHNLKIYNCNVSRSYRTGGVCMSCVSNMHAKNVTIDETGYQIGMFWGVCAFQCVRTKDSVVEECVFKNTIIANSTDPDGQGFDFEADNTNVTVRNCQFLDNAQAGILCYGQSWPGENHGNLVDGCYFEGNNKLRGDQIFAVGQPENWGMVKNCTIKLRRRDIGFYCYPMVFDESNVVMFGDEVLYGRGPDRSNPLFSDDFSSTLSKWENTNRASINSGRVAIENSRYIYVAEGKTWTDYFVEAEMVCSTDVASPSIIFRMDTDTKDFYVARWMLRSNNRSSIDIYKAVEGRDRELLASYQCRGMRPDMSNKVRVETQGNIIRIFMDNNLMGTFTDDSYAIGSIGLAGGSEGEALFDNVVVGKM